MSKTRSYDWLWFLLGFMGGLALTVAVVVIPLMFGAVGFVIVLGSLYVIYWALCFTFGWIASKALRANEQTIKKREFSRSSLPWRASWTS